MHYRTRSGSSCYVQETGDPSGPLFILIHGLGGSSDTFTSILESLQPEINRLCCIDLEGFGKTGLSAPSVPITIQRYVNDLESLVASLQSNALDKGPITLIGHSLGSIIAMHYAVQNPEHIYRLILLGAGRSIAHIPAAQKRMLEMARLVREKGISAVAELAAVSNFPADSDVAQYKRDAVRQAVAASDPEGYARACEAVAGADHLDPDYGLISAPTLLLAGSGDIISPPERSVALQKLIGNNASVKVLDSVGHQMILSDCEGTINALQGWV